MKIRLRRSPDHTERDFDTTTEEAAIVEWLNGQDGYVCTVYSDPELTISVLTQQPRYIPGRHPIFRPDWLTNTYQYTDQ